LRCLSIGARLPPDKLALAPDRLDAASSLQFAQQKAVGSILNGKERRNDSSAKAKVREAGKWAIVSIAVPRKQVEERSAEQQARVYRKQDVYSPTQMHG
jgi:hypothetical protein